MTQPAVDPVFAGAPAPVPAFERGGFDSLANLGFNADVAVPLPEILSGRRVVFNNEAAPWGDHGPLWGIRGFNVIGAIHRLALWRCGDWTKGREGTAVYLNVAGDLLLEDIRAVQCGGQALQIVWRPGETRIPESLWPSARNLITLRRYAAIDCGAITAGMAVRASWPFSIFSTGARVHMESCSVQTRLRPFTGDRGATYRSHGALLVTEGEVGARTPELIVDGFKAAVTSPDRSMVRLSGVDLAVLRGGALVVSDGPAIIDVIDTCHAVKIIAPAAPVQVRLFAAADQWHNPYRVENLAAGGTYSWTKP